MSRAQANHLLDYVRAGGDEVATLLRLDTMLAPKGAA